MINEKELIQTLAAETSKDPTLNAVLHMFAARDRARAQVTLQALAARMKEEGFSYEDAEYIRVLRLLAKLGVGRLETDSSGRVKALKDVKVTLQSIGLAGLGQLSRIEHLNKRNRFQKVGVNRPTIVKVSPEIKLEPAYAPHRPRIQPRPAPGEEWMILCVKLSTGEIYKTYVPKNITKDDALLIGKALSDMVK